MKVNPVINYKCSCAASNPHFKGREFRWYPASSFNGTKDKNNNIIKSAAVKIQDWGQKLFFNRIINSMNKSLKNEKSIAKIKNISQFKADIINIANIAAKDEQKANILLQTVFKNLNKVKDVDLFCVMTYAAKKSSHGYNMGNQDFLVEAVSAFITETNTVKRSALASFIHINDTKKLFSPILEKFIKNEPRAKIILSA